MFAPFTTFTQIVNFSNKIDSPLDYALRISLTMNYFFKLAKQ